MVFEAIPSLASLFAHIDSTAKILTLKYQSRTQSRKAFGYGDIKAAVSSLDDDSIKSVEFSEHNDDMDWWEDECIDSRLKDLFELGLDACSVQIGNSISAAVQKQRFVQFHIFKLS